MSQPYDSEQLDVEKLISAVRGSEAARILFEYRAWSSEGHVVDVAPLARQEDEHVRKPE